jgi:hypothetical protein
MEDTFEGLKMSGNEEENFGMLIVIGNCFTDDF